MCAFSARSGRRLTLPALGEDLFHDSPDAHDLVGFGCAFVARQLWCTVLLCSGFHLFVQRGFWVVRSWLILHLFVQPLLGCAFFVREGGGRGIFARGVCVWLGFSCCFRTAVRGSSPTFLKPLKYRFDAPRVCGVLCGRSGSGRRLQRQPWILDLLDFGRSGSGCGFRFSLGRLLRVTLRIGSAQDSLDFERRPLHFSRLRCNNTRTFWLWWVTCLYLLVFGRSGSGRGFRFSLGRLLRVTLRIGSAQDSLDFERRPLHFSRLRCNNTRTFWLWWVTCLYLLVFGRSGSGRGLLQGQP